MSVDEALLQALRQGLAPVTLRFYRWEPPTVSLGYFQEASDVDLVAIEALGFGLVRRPTGGRAILHDDELTYSVALPASAVPGGRSLGRSYRALSDALVAGLLELGVQATVGDEKAERNSLPAACFALSTRADLTAQGRKVIGSAQVRHDGYILQHGSIPLTLNMDRHATVFGRAAKGGEDGAGDLAEKAQGLADLLGWRPGWEQLAAALAGGFERSLGVTPEAGSLSAEERELAAQIEREKYGHDDFNLRAPQRKARG